MSFISFGINYESAPIEVRDAFALDESALRRVYEQAAAASGAEFVLLSTCNRTECYLYGEAPDVKAVQQAWRTAAGADWPEAHAFELWDEAAVGHVLQVACGLRSMVLGDGQILSQVKAAYRLADDCERVGAVMHRLMHTAFRAAKRVAAETGVTSGTVSVASAAVAMARAHLDEQGRPGLEGARVVVLGAGKMASLALQVLHKMGAAEILLANRTPARGEALAARFGARVLPWERRYEALAQADVVFVATGSEAPVVQADRLPRRAAGGLLVDLATPRNVAPEAAFHEGYRVLDLDHLNAWIGRMEARRRTQAPLAAAICDELLVDFVTWMFHQQALQPGIQTIRDTFEAIRLREIERHHHRFSGVDRHELDVLTRSIMQKLLAIPIVRLKHVGPEHLDFARGIHLLQYLFSQPACEEGGAPAPQAPELWRTLTARWPEPADPEAPASAAEAFCRDLLRG